LVVAAFTPIFAEGSMEDAEAPLFPANAPFANEYLAAYTFLTTGVQEEFGMITLSMAMIEDETAQKQEFQTRYKQITEKYEKHYTDIEVFCERMVAGRYMTAAESEVFLDAIRNCNLMLFITFAMMSTMMDMGELVLTD